MNLKHAAIISLISLVLAPLDCGAEGDIKSLSQYEYWDVGGERKRDVYDLKGRLRMRYYFRQDESCEKVEKYNAFGKMIEEAFFDEKGSLKKWIDGWAAMRWFYDDSLLLSQVAYDEVGKPMQRLVYSESGKLIYKQYREDIDVGPYEYLNTFDIIMRNRESVINDRQ